MTLEQFLALLDGARPSGRGWMARCPAHADHSPSLSIREGDDGRILVYCFAGCSVGEVCSALGLSLADLFPAKDCGQQLPAKPRPLRRDFRWIAAQFQGHALALRLRAKLVHDQSRRLDISQWSEGDLNTALDAVASAFRDEERAEVLDDVAVSLRARALAERGAA